MIYLLFFTLIAMAGAAFIAERRDILSPWTISCIMFAVSTFFAVANVNRWGYSLTPSAVIVILSGLLAFGAGSMLAAFVSERSRPAEPVKAPALEAGRAEPRRPLDLPAPVIAVSCAVMLAVFAYVFVETYKYSVEVGNDKGVSGMIYYTYTANIQPGNRLGRAVGHLNLISESIRTVFLFFFFYNCILSRFRKKWLFYLLPPAIDVFTQTLGTGRVFAIRLAAMSLLTAFVMYNIRYRWNRRVTFRIIGFGAAALALFFLVFTLLGFLTGKTGVRSVWDTISIYTGLSIPSLDVYLNTPHEPPSIWGEETLYGIHDILRTLGADIPERVRHLEFVHFGDFAGNVFTSLRRYIHDYGFAGMLLIQFALGLLYSSFYNFIKTRQTPGFSLIVYSYLFYTLAMQGIDDVILSMTIGTTIIYRLVYLAIAYYLLKSLAVGRERVYCGSREIFMFSKCNR